LSCSHIGSKGIIVSRLQAVVQYGGSVIIQSILHSGIDFISSKQSQQYNMFTSNMYTTKQIKTNNPIQFISQQPKIL